MCVHMCNVCMFSCVHMCTEKQSMPMYRGQKSTSGSSFTNLYLVSLKQDLLLNLKIAISARLADQLAFGIHLSLSPYHT